MIESDDAEPTADVSDEQLVDGFLNGDREAFACLYRRYYGRTYRLAYAMTGTRDEAEDLTQEVFMRAYGRLAQFERKSRFTTWFYRVAVNVCLRRRSRTRFVDVPIEEAADVASPDPIESGIFADQVHAEVRRALLSLKPTPRMIVVLKDIEGLSYAEIAERMDCSEGTIASRLNRARRLLGRKLGHLKGVLPR